MRAGRRTITLALALVLCAGFQYDPLPADNLLVNPWFRNNCAYSAQGWSVDQASTGASWGQSIKDQDPSDVDCGGTYEGTAIRWARRSGATPEFSPNEDVRFWQVVGPVDATQTTLRFHFLLVAHRMTRVRAQISGSPGPDGPWTPVWTPFDKGWLARGGANAPFDRTCDGGLTDRTCLWAKVTEVELGSLAPLVHELDTGYPYYRIEMLGNYPDPDATTTGDVGAKIARVYFALGAAPPPGPDAGAPSGDDAGPPGGAASDAAGCCQSHGPTGSFAAPALLAALVLRRRRPAAI